MEDLSVHFSYTDSAVERGREYAAYMQSMGVETKSLIDCSDFIMIVDPSDPVSRIRQELAVAKNRRKNIWCVYLGEKDISKRVFGSVPSVYDGEDGPQRLMEMLEKDELENSEKKSPWLIIVPVAVIVVVLLLTYFFGDFEDITWFDDSYMRI